MMTEKELQSIAKKGIKLASGAGADLAEIVLSHGTEDLTRFANNMIHQSVSLTDGLVHVRLAFGKKIGVARTNRLDDEGMKEAVKTAKTLALLQRPDPHFAGLPGKSGYESTEDSYSGQPHMGAVGRAGAIGVIITAAKKAKLTASGAFVESENVSCVANSQGVWAFTRGKSASVSTILMGVKGSGFASHSTKGGSFIDVQAVAKQAVFKATHGRLMDVQPGEYEVILEPPAVAELMDFFSWLGPNARVFHENVSFYQGNIGKRVLHPSLTIHDDPTNPAGYPLAFDWEGFPKKKRGLVENGVLTGVAYDSYHAAKYNAVNTGHALLAPNTMGPIPTHVVIEPGSDTTKKAIKRIKKGLLITRFWYTRVIHHKKLLLTGMTRDGTFYIENGKIVGRVRNLRYTESVIEALGDVRGIGRDLQLIGSEGSPSLVPFLHLGKFRFTGVTKHG